MFLSWSCHLHKQRNGVLMNELICHIAAQCSRNTTTIALGKWLLPQEANSSPGKTIQKGIAMATYPEHGIVSPLGANPRNNGWDPKDTITIPQRWSVAWLGFGSTWNGDQCYAMEATNARGSYLQGNSLRSWDPQLWMSAWMRGGVLGGDALHPVCRTSDTAQPNTWHCSVFRQSCEGSKHLWRVCGQYVAISRHKLGTVTLAAVAQRWSGEAA